MTGSTPFKISQSENFMRTLKACVKSYKSDREKQAFKDFLFKIRSQLSLKPNPELPDSVVCPRMKFKDLAWPDACEIRKFFFQMPFRKSGASGEGRIMYLVDYEFFEVNLVWLYTHEKYKKQPPYDALEEVFYDLIKSRSVN